MRSTLLGFMVAAVAFAGVVPMPVVVGQSAPPPDPPAPPPLPPITVPLTPAEPAATAPKLAGPRLQVDAPTHDFGKVPAGELVKHTFILKNVGDAVLEIRDVRPSCGCTAASNWDRRIEPGQTGSIPIQFNSGGFGGNVSKTVTVTSNDPQQPSLGLQIKGLVWKPLEVVPLAAYFNVVSEAPTNQTRTVKIISNLEEPLKLSTPECTNQCFKAEVREVRPGKEFELLITAMPPFAGPFVQSPITVKTSSAQAPLITVQASATVQEPVWLVPTQFVLPAGPLTNSMRPSVTIRNSGTNNLVLSDPVLDVPNTQIQIQEAQPGRIFVMSVQFPPGFQVQPGQSVEVKVKTNHPKYPVLTVPVIQRQRVASLPTSGAQPPVPRPALRPASAPPAPTTASRPQ